MAVTKTTISNDALRAIGAEKISDFATDTTVRGVQLQDLYDHTRDKLLRRSDWSFAQKRASLTVDTASPTSGWEYQFPVPSDWIRTTSVSPFDSDMDRGYTPYAMGVIPTAVSPDEAGRKIFTNASTCYLLYVYQCDDPTLYSADFVDAFAQELAYRLIKAGVKSTQSATEQRVEARRALAIAMSTDGIEDDVKWLPDGSWVNERFI